MNRIEAVAIARAARMAKQPSLHDRFWNKVKILGADDCWNWLAAVRRKDQGYGAFWMNGRHHPSNRIAWLLTNGEIKSGLVVCHKCDNPSCCNPSHLFLGTSLENNNDKVSKQRHCFGEKNGLSKLTTEQVIKIKAQKLKRGADGRADLKKSLANKYGVKPGTISDIWTRSWRHLD